MKFLDKLFSKKFDVQIILDEDYGRDDYFTIKASVKSNVISWMYITKHNNDNFLYINDIIFDSDKYINKGIGTKMMSKLIEYAIENGFKEIQGKLSVVDDEHKDRLHHFYKKFDFQIENIDDPNDCFYALICKKIQ